MTFHFYAHPTKQWLGWGIADTSGVSWVMFDSLDADELTVALEAGLRAAEEGPVEVPHPVPSSAPFDVTDVSHGAWFLMSFRNYTLRGGVKVRVMRDPDEEPAFVEPPAQEDLPTVVY